MSVGKGLVAASSTPLALAILAEGGSYGYAILKRVKEVSEGRFAWSDGMLYPLLHRLERQAYVEPRRGASESGRRRRYYRLTARGRAEPPEEREQWHVVDAALRSVWSGLRASMEQGPVPAGRSGARLSLTQGG
jgi:PadR family transcriptional regulator, regulatory protein PadR